MTYQNILVALDRSPQGETVFNKALEFAKPNQSQVTLFYCLPADTDSIGSYSDLYGQEMKNFSHAVQEHRLQEIEAVEEWLSSYCEQASQQGVTAEWKYKIGDADQTICEMAQDQGVDLIILGRRGRKGLEEIFLGSVSNYVVHHAPCSVLIVQGI